MSDRVSEVLRRSHDRTEQMLDRALEIGRSTFEPFEYLQLAPDEPPPPPPMTMPEPRRRTR